MTARRASGGLSSRSRTTRLSPSKVGGGQIPASPTTVFLAARSVGGRNAVILIQKLSEYLAASRLPSGGERMGQLKTLQEYLGGKFGFTALVGQRAGLSSCSLRAVALASACGPVICTRTELAHPHLEPEPGLCQSPAQAGQPELAARLFVNRSTFQPGH